jgi:hypothetical protein
MIIVMMLGKEPGDHRYDVSAPGDRDAVAAR